MEFSLKQNSPNPFNNITSINYNIPDLSFVSLVVYDVNGNVNKILVNENKNAGRYNVTWSPENLSSGIYYFKLNIKNKTFIRKGILIR